MTIATNIVLADAQATPVNHTFIPLGRDTVDPTSYWFVDQSQANALGYWKIRVQIKQPSMTVGPSATSANRVYRYNITLFEPVLEALSNNSAGYTPAPTVAYTPRAEINFVLPERSTLQNRKDIRKMTALLAADVANITAVVENLLTFNA